MPVTNTRVEGATSDTRIRLRRDLYDARTAELGATTVAKQADLIGVTERTLFRIRRGDVPSLPTAVKISDALGTPLSVLFEMGGQS